jgi:cell wall-associated NlpC family hydrolase
MFSWRGGIIACFLWALLFSGCASPGAHLRGGLSGERLVGTARQALGVRYQFAGNSPREGFDCSGLVHWAFQKNGVSVPRSTGALYAQGHRVKKRDLLPGDLVFFDITGAGPSHVGIYSGGGRMVHAPSTGGKVQEVSIEIKYWVRRFLSGRRLD